MTSPIALLGSLAAPDPASAPLPAEDAALFAAALIAALQTALLPVPAPAVPTAPPPAASGDEDVTAQNDAPDEQRPVPPAVATSEASPDPPGIGRGLEHPPAHEAPHDPVPRAAEAEPLPREGSVNFSLPFSSEGGGSLPLTGTEAERGNASPTSSQACMPSPPRQSDREAGLAPQPDHVQREALPPSSGQDRAPRIALTRGPAPASSPAVALPALPAPEPPVASSRIHPCGTPADDTIRSLEVPSEATLVAAAPRTPPSSSPDRPRDEARDRISRSVVTPPAVTPVVMPAPAPAGAMAALVPDGTPTPSPPAGQTAIEPSTGDSRAGSGTAGRCESPLGVSRNDAPSAALGAAVGSSAATASDSGFARALTEILGDAAITDMRLIEGRGASTAPLGRVPSEAAIPAIVARAAPIGRTTVESPLMGGDAAVVTAALATSFPTRRSRESPGREMPAAVDAQSDVPKHQESEVPRLTRAVAPRVAPEPMPFVDRSGSRAAERTLPVSRQELPAPAERSERDPAPSRAVARDEPSPPSDGRGGVSASPEAQNEPSTRGEIRVHESASGEARNLPKEMEAREHPAGVADRVTLQVADAEGRQTRIRVAVLGDQIRAVIQPPDGEAARHLVRRMDELQAALVRQGFVDPKVTVQVAATSAEVAAPWGGAAIGGPTDPAPSRGMDQPAGDQRQGTGRREQGRQGDGQRHPQQRSPERDPQDRRR